MKFVQQVRCLEMLCLSLMYLEDPWREIGYGTMAAILKGSNPAEIIPVLSILKDLIPRVDIDQWKPLWPDFVRLARHTNPVVRQRVYEIFQKAFDLVEHQDPHFAPAILRGCTDTNAELANTMQNFLADKLPTDSTMDRLLMYLSHFYASSTEDCFIAFFSHFLLERTTHSQQYSQPIFDKPLDDVPFEWIDFSASISQSSQSPSRSWQHRSKLPTTRTFQVNKSFRNLNTG